jgi:hypothetical protein
MTKTNRLSRRRKRLWDKNPHCHWCGKITVLPDGRPKIKRPPLNLATIDHLNSRHSPDRHKPNNGQEIRTVLACWQCNNERSRIEELSIPIEKRWEISKRYPKKLTYVAKIIRFLRRIKRLQFWKNLYIKMHPLPLRGIRS